MFIMFGWGKVTTKEVGSAGKVRCGRCGNVREWPYKKYTTWFTLFFIPIIPYKNILVKECPICKGAIVVDKEETSPKEGTFSNNSADDGLTDVQRNYRKAMEEHRESKDKDSELVNSQDKHTAE